MIPFISTYSPDTARLVRTIRGHFHQFVEASGCLQNHRMIAAYRKNQNLQDLLVRAKVPQLLPTRPRPVGDKGDFFQHQEWVQNRHNKNIFKSRCQGSLKSKNCVYVIQCKQCNIHYVGETGNTIATRFTQHRHNITKQKNTKTHLVQHFLQHGWQSVRAMVVESNPRWSTAQRRRAEKIWISRLGSRYPGGLNERH